jgi:hypothetical protein
MILSFEVKQLRRDVEVQSRFAALETWVRIREVYALQRLGSFSDGWNGPLIEWLSILPKILCAGKASDWLKLSSSRMREK